jgi:molybdopterin-synthase adenylyltransferase
MVERTVAMGLDVHAQAMRHLYQRAEQEDLTFVAWRPSYGSLRTCAVVNRLLLPDPDERELHGNVAFTAAYLQRALGQLREGEGLGLAHCHFGPGWQDMSNDDVVAERDRLAGAAFGRTGKPLLGLTSGTDGSWSGRFWERYRPGRYRRHGASAVRVVGPTIQWTRPKASSAPIEALPTQVATVSVWGQVNQATLVRCRIGIVGLGSVGSLVCEALARMGAEDVVLIDDDHIELRNLDRTAGALRTDATHGRLKVDVARRNAKRVATSPRLKIRSVAHSLLTADGLKAALDCDVLVACVDRPWPRHVLNTLAYSHLVPVMDGGILARVENERLVHVTWRIHSVGPGRACLVCLGALDRGDIGLDMDGKLDDPDYIANLPEEMRELVSRRNVYPFSMSVAAHQVLQLVALVTGEARVGGRGPQVYHAYPGEMQVLDGSACKVGCEYRALLASAPDLTGNLRKPAASD